MIERPSALLLSGVGGLYTALTETGETRTCRAKGAFRKAKMSPLVGDRVYLREPEAEGEDYLIEEILPRKNALIRPPIANLDMLFVAFAPHHPEPSTLYLDKLLSIAVFHGIRPVVIITKHDLDDGVAAHYADIYRKAGFAVFLCSSLDGDGITPLAAFVREQQGLCAFAGASGVGKSTLMNALFPKLALTTGALSEKIARGKHTTRAVSLYPIDESERPTRFIADTPGFSMLDFIEFDFYSLEDLPHCFPEFEAHLSECRYTDCTHTKEEECGITQAVRRGEIARERHESYLSIYQDLASKKPWEKK